MADSILNYVKSLRDRQVSIAPLVTFRIVFGLLMFAGILRFWWRGWITSVYVLPEFHFTYTGFDWVKPLRADGMHLLFALIALAALFIALGFLYRVATVIFFLGFTYVELIDATTYLNHYYFISLVAFLLIFLPANRDYSIDARVRPGIRRKFVPAWCIGIIRFQLGIVYFFAGLAKLNVDWLFNAQPMRTWLPAKTHLPIVGPYMYEAWVAYLFSWFGAIYDLFIVFFLLNRRTTLAAYAVVVIFHVATAIFFPGIGMFPYVMISCTLIYFSGAFHEKLLSLLPFYRKGSEVTVYRYKYPKALSWGISIYILIQLIVPLRFLAYPGKLFWNEEGYRFSWRVMLMEKSGAAYFKVTNKEKTQYFEVNNAEFLTPLQEKMMSTQPDMIVKYAHFLADEYKKRGVNEPQVYAEIYVLLNGDRSKLFVDTSVNLAAQPQGFVHYSWVLPYNRK